MEHFVIFSIRGRNALLPWASPAAGKRAAPCAESEGKMQFDTGCTAGSALATRAALLLRFRVVASMPTLFSGAWLSARRQTAGKEPWTPCSGGKSGQLALLARLKRKWKARNLRSAVGENQHRLWSPYALRKSRKRIDLPIVRSPDHTIRAFDVT